MTLGFRLGCFGFNGVVGSFLNLEGLSAGGWVVVENFKDIILLMSSVGFVDVVLKAYEVLS